MVIEPWSGKGDLGVPSGLIHDWGLLNPISQVPAVRTAILQVCEELKHRLR